LGGCTQYPFNEAYDACIVMVLLDVVNTELVDVARALPLSERDTVGGITFEPVGIG
jgi:hypothetical protein